MRHELSFLSVRLSTFSVINIFSQFFQGFFAAFFLPLPCRRITGNAEVRPANVSARYCKGTFERDGFTSERFFIYHKVRRVFRESALR